LCDASLTGHVEHIYDEIDPPDEQGPYDDQIHHTGTSQPISNLEINLCGNLESHDNSNQSKPDCYSVVDKTNSPKEIAQSQPSAVMKQPQRTITPDVICIPMTDRRKASPLSVSTYRRNMMNTTLSYSDDEISATLPAQRAKWTRNENFKAIHNKLLQTAVTTAGNHKQVFDDTISPKQHTSMRHPALVQSNSTLATVERVAVVSKKQIDEENTTPPLQQDLCNNAPSPILCLRAKTTTQHTNDINIFTKETSMSEDIVTVENQVDDAEKRHTTNVAPTNKEEATLQKHPTTVDKELSHSTFTTIL